jgi:hypothetical protein
MQRAWVEKLDRLHRPSISHALGALDGAFDDVSVLGLGVTQDDFDVERRRARRRDAPRARARSRLRCSRANERARERGVARDDAAHLEVRTDRDDAGTTRDDYIK